MSEETCSAERLNSVLEEYKQNLNDVSQLIRTSQDNTSDQETGEVFAHLLKKADEIQHLLEDGVDITNLHTLLESGLHFIRDILLKKRADPMRSLNYSESTVHPVGLSSIERGGLKRRLKGHASELEGLLSGIREKEKLRLSISLINLDLHDSPIACIPTFADVGAYPSKCLEPLLREGENGDLKYTLKCPSAGLFECKFTSLMFEMNMPGKVEYHSVPWENHLDDLHCEPAGPLYNISCFPGTPVQMHFPHCEVISDGKLKHLRVAHITGNGLEIIKPKEITESHVVINVTGLSKFGLFCGMKSFFNKLFGRNIRVMVLPFLQQGSKPLLKVLLVARNTPIQEVKKKREKMIYPKKEIYIDGSNLCKIHTRTKYKLVTQPAGLIVEPEKAKYDKSNPELVPTFKVHCKAEKEVRLVLKDKTKERWSCLVNIEEEETLNGRQHVSEPAVSKDFFQNHKGALETRLPTVLGPILNQLVQMKVLTTTEREAIEKQPTDNKRNVCLLRMLGNKGTKAQAIFCQVLQAEDPFLVEDLEKNN